MMNIKLPPFSIEKTMSPEWHKHLTKHPSISFGLYLAINKIDEMPEYCFMPHKHNIFRMFKEQSPDEIKLIILGQDPFHNIYNKLPSACGIAFATENGYKSPSLTNIFKELKQDLGINYSDYSLKSWRKNGIFLLNTALTVKQGVPGSHILMWKDFMKSLLPSLVDKTWLLLGKSAQSWAPYIKGEIIMAPHPSPLSRTFPGSKIFSKTAHIINWKEACQVPENI